LPHQQHDDIVDSVTQALNYLRAPREAGILVYYRQEAEVALRLRFGVSQS